MNLIMQGALADDYKSPSQKARVVTEDWIARELYCPNCLAKSIDSAPVNHRAVDYYCPSCSSPFQLKSSKTGLRDRIPDGAYESMISTIRANNTPNLLLLNYDVTSWTVLDLLIVPYFALSEQAIVRRKPLAPTARRAGWVGCNIDLSEVLPEARIAIVKNQQAIDPNDVSDSIARIAPLSQIGVNERGWAFAVMIALKSRALREFTTAGAYAIETELEKKFPNNKNVRPKIRQQLQVLRDLGFLAHESRGHWNFL